MEYRKILRNFRSHSLYKQLLQHLQEKRTIAGLGLLKGARLPLIASIYEDTRVPILYLTGRSDRALMDLDELAFWSGTDNCLLFPEPNPMFYEQAAWGNVNRRERLRALIRLAASHLPRAESSSYPPLIVAPIRALMTCTMPRRDFLINSRLISPGMKTSFHDLQTSFAQIGYDRNDTVLEPGQFSRRGGLLDIWPPAEDQPVRLDFFGDELETIRRFDPATQRTSTVLEQILLTPAREAIHKKASENDLPIAHLDEFSIPLIYPSPSTLLDYLPSESLVILDDMDLIQMTAVDVEEQAEKFRRECISEGTLDPNFPLPYLSWSEVFDEIQTLRWIELGRATAEEGGEWTQRFYPGSRFGGRVRPFIDHLVERSNAGDSVVVISRQASRLSALWQETMPALPANAVPPEILEGSLSEGFTCRSDDGLQWHLITDSEIFGWERPKPRQRQLVSVEAPESTYSDLHPGDWMVHMDYGVGRFVGLVTRTLEGVVREFLCVEYEGGDQLFVPIHQADRLSRYVGPDGNPPTLTKLGTSEWMLARQRVQTAVSEIAGELLDLYAKRQVAVGHAFPPDGAWQQELEASFPYVETADQLLSIQDVKHDMEMARPMDRLLCGDVGYGKTEVALRASFKAVMDGKQVAVLVPTTVLAQQHFETFSQRLAAYPVNVEMLSRFRSPLEQGRILDGLNTGAIDIVIGTHRLVQPDIHFKDLGLVVIDEEQRFGVAHKEYLKRLRTEVDVLTLTATPIPRTLYMALTGVRDISTINTPPEERLPVITHIGPYSPRLVRQAILRELERGGQVFIVHNRVQSILAMQAHLNKLIPEARIGVAHGQLPEAELANVMHLFTQAEIDILLCTSIIESGLDIPNANTLIVDRADTFGLAQLYQLRGRVGRGAQRAYAYFFRHGRRSPTLEGQMRLDVIAENSQLGSGYSIAMRDLEMRGAGELLGSKQHGYIAAVGFHLYTRMLAQAVRELRSMRGLSENEKTRIDRESIRLPVTVDLPLNVGIPASYVPEQSIRLQLYRRLANLQHVQELMLIKTEFMDRFGPLPEDTENLFYQLSIRQLAEASGLSSITVEADQLVLRFPPLPEGVHARDLPQIHPQVRTGKNAYWMPLNGNSHWRESLQEVLSAIISLCPSS